ncbi:MAG: hypothetical protein Q8P57_04995 [Candidatus Pacearchaeota archaeon]|nr:hypothetical protein [Candidatus Pacearchaeota archaeon]
MNKRGVLSLSFGMIFSIIMIIAIVGVASYIIISFIGLGSDTEVVLFHQEFQETIDEIWGSAITNKVFSFNLPGNIELVCFGDLKGSTYELQYKEEYDEFKEFSSNFEKENTNRFIYPMKFAGDFAFSEVDRISLTGLGSDFECFEVKSGKIEVRLEKGDFDSSVRIKRP